MKRQSHIVNITNKDTKEFTKTLLGLFMVSLSLMLFQVGITRVFSAILAYHYVFLVTSFAILGLAAGSLTVYKVKQFEIWLNHMPMLFLGECSFFISLSYILVLLVISTTPYLGGVLPYLILGIVPFCLGGVFISAIFKNTNGNYGRLYFADLLGAGIGSVAVCFIIDGMGMMRSFIIVSLIASVASLVLLAGRSGFLYIIFNTVFIGILATNLCLPRAALYMEKNFRPILNAPEKYIEETRRINGRMAQKINLNVAYTKWDSFSRTDVIEIKEEPYRKSVTIDATAYSGMFRFDGNLEMLKNYYDNESYLPTTGYIPFIFGRSKNVALIGTGGGRDILYALAGRSEKISAVEINKSSVDAARFFKEFNGNIYDRDNVKVYIKDGRNFIKNSPEKFDVIFMSLIKTGAAGNIGLSLSENFIYTVESIEEYLEYLNDDGKLAFMVHEEASITKLAATAMRALKKRGIKEDEIPLHMAVIDSKSTFYRPEGTVYMPLLIVRKKQFTEKEAEELMSIAGRQGNTCLFVPYLKEIGSLGQIRTGKMRMQEFHKHLSYDAEPATDDRPYFYNFDHEIFKILTGALLGIILLYVIFLLPVVTKKKISGISSYFILLGIGFIMIEISIIQKFILYLGHPTLAFSVVLFVLLAGGGLGSYFASNKNSVWIKRGRCVPCQLIFLIATILCVVLPFIFSVTSGFQGAFKIIVSAAAVFPLGFFMGMPFPVGLEVLRSTGGSKEIPLIWGINGTMTVAGSIISVILSMLFGFNAALVTGALIYLAAFWLYRPIFR